MISYKHNCMFFHCQKTGGTTIKNFLQRNNKENLVLWEHVRVRDLEEITHKEQWHKFFKFSFVRNPWSRLVSNYFFCRSHTVHADLKQYVTTHSFEEYVMEGQEWWYLTPQWDQLVGESGELELDFIGRYENFTRDFKRVSKELGIKPPAKFKKWNKSRHRGFRSYYNKESIERVAEVYYKDIEAFNYKFDRITVL